jgi:DNA-binding response OmpR family regulator
MSEGKPRRVAVIEPDERSGVVLTRALEARGWTVIRVQRSRDLARWQSPDILVAALDGDEAGVLEALVRLAAGPRKTPVVLLSRRASARVLDSLRALGVDRLIGWPCRVQEIVAAIDELCAARRPAPAPQAAEEPVRMVS